MYKLVKSQPTIAKSQMASIRLTYSKVVKGLSFNDRNWLSTGPQSRLQASFKGPCRSNLLRCPVTRPLIST
ncbi:hypothetical protein BY996DRAFT_2757116 [Phakopsora pachyrhizi]|nr:hypothetical protein BY996DRAFT_2757116 [Phakopsora pachyrhizi]